MENEQRIKEIIIKYPAERRFSLAVMQDIQRAFNYIPKEAMIELSEYLNVPFSQLYSMATFYKALSLNPKGKYVIKVCDGTACHIRSSMVILSELQKLLGIEAGEITADGLFSVETVNCLGACALAPVMVVNGEYHGKLTPQDLSYILDGYRENSEVPKDDLNLNREGEANV
ncbi:NADH-quinone oxidoreductase subunit NuoE [Anoxybacterium hadale]|uniref:NADH-quinone oxidoreductase subunit NuoE n=1 Tax=Anoxybacterium hadale TaxID=3408580 RepID=A0ACD1A870_9FIRM|nr:NADH-quinone oxidoreductase subunit NuoE [Clostridiales bacterium]